MTRHATARLFVAVDLPGGTREQLAAWARSALRAAGGRPGAGHPLRVLDAELLHVTLCFLGNRPADEIETIGALLAEAVEDGYELAVGAPLWLPRRHPRVLAVELHDDEDRLERLQQRLLASLQAVCDFEDGSHGADAHHRRFRPHVTVARMRAGAAPAKRALEPTPPLRFRPTKLVLYRSWLSPEGASYEALASAPLV